MSLFKSNKLASIQACLAPSVDPLLKYFLINSESDLLSTLEIAF